MRRTFYVAVVTLLLALASAGPGLAGGLPSVPVVGSGQENDAEQGQVQVVPVAPQVNVQNVNVATFGEVEQGDANNANTGQAVQQENTQAGHGGKHHPKPAPKPCESKCEPKHGYGWKHDAGQRNEADQKQLQVVPIAPQANLQNVNVLTFGEVEQGDASNANTGQAVQQENTQAGHGGKRHPRPAPKPCESRCEPTPKPAPKPCERACEPKHEPKHEPRPCTVDRCEPKHEPGHGPKPCEDACKPKHEPKPCKPDRACEPRHEPCKPNEHRHGPGHGHGHGEHGGPVAAQRNEADQRQVQVVPVAPQLNLQNVDVLTFGDVEQGDAANANTGQVAQQSNALLGSPAKGGGLPALL